MPDARPFLKMVGGKRQLLPELQKHIPAKFGRYHEPFLGGGALFFALDLPHGAFLSDVNGELIRTWTGIQTGVEHVIMALKAHAHIHPSDPERYFAAARAVDWHALSSTDIAARMIYLNKTCFNGLYRVNRAGKFNVPLGKAKTPPMICDEPNLRAVAKHLTSKVFIAQRDFRDAERGVKADDLIYMDPPYAPVSKTSDFTSYTTGKFTDDDQRDLRDMARRLKMKGARVIVSNSNAAIIDELYGNADFEIHRVAARRNVNSRGARRGAVTEYIIT